MTRNDKLAVCGLLILTAFGMFQISAHRKEQTMTVAQAEPSPFVFSTDPAPVPLFEASADMKDLTIYGQGKELVRIDLRTGQVTLSGDPNEAARIFWEAVAQRALCSR